MFYDEVAAELGYTPDSSAAEYGLAITEIDSAHWKRDALGDGDPESPDATPVEEGERWEDSRDTHGGWADTEEEKERPKPRPKPSPRPRPKGGKPSGEVAEDAREGRTVKPARSRAKAAKPRADQQA